MFAYFPGGPLCGSLSSTEADGIVSVVDGSRRCLHGDLFTPVIFVTLVAGILIDRTPGLAGHQHFFMFLATLSAVGALISWIMIRRAGAFEVQESHSVGARTAG